MKTPMTTATPSTNASNRCASIEPGRQRACLAAILCAGLLAHPAVLWAQSADIASQDRDQDRDEASQHVEESEEAFRRRMETAESHDQSDVMRPRSSGTTQVPEGIDALPADSRKHLRDELRNVIIEQGEWQPEDAGKVYPYTPSAAAEKDPELRQQEQQAWGELVQEYHKREAAALAMGGGRAGSQASDEQRNASSAGSQGNAGARSPSNPAERSSQREAENTAAGAGVSQSALEFLKAQQGGASGGQQAAGAGDSARQVASASRQDTASPSQPATPPAQDSAAQSSADQPAEKERRPTDETNEPEPPPGSLAIAELAALEKTALEKAAGVETGMKPAAPAEPEPDPESGGTSQQPVTQAVLRQSSEPPHEPPPPGTLPIPELEKLKGLEETPPPEVIDPQADR